VSLSHLHRRPIDPMKHDKSFVDRIGEASEDREIVPTIVDLALRSKLEVIAEAVDPESQVQALRDQQCTRPRPHRSSHYLRSL
jgi:EAL domain-containing protein (putative c-di-GMP-specific phosphodiesterase class I)